MEIPNLLIYINIIVVCYFILNDKFFLYIYFFSITASRTWIVVEVDWCPVPRYFSTAVCIDGTIYVYGGKNKMNKCFGDIYALSLGKCSFKGFPSPLPSCTFLGSLICLYFQ